MKFLSRFKILGILSLFSLGAQAQADVKVHPLFSNGMVLQRNQDLPVWGTAAPGEEVYVHLKIKTTDGTKEEGVTVKTDKDGAWMAKLAQFPAGTDGVLTVKGAEPKDKKANPNQVVLKDVLVGEVWICSGQSNMNWRLSQTENAEAVAKDATNPNIRFYTVPRWPSPTPQKEFLPAGGAKKGESNQPAWQMCDPKTALTFSAVGYYFGRDIQKALNVPVGLIHTSVGGTPAEAWTSLEGLQADPTSKYYAEDFLAKSKGYSAEQAKKDYDAAMEKHKEAVEKAKKDGKPAPKAPAMRAAPGSGQNDPTSLYNGMIANIIPYAIKGAIWYQGESNGSLSINGPMAKLPRAVEYRDLYAAMITDWRKRWGYDFHFYCVQLAPFNAGSADGINYAVLRESQAIASAKVKKAGVATITDAGDVNDIHPKKKQPCGARMALMALAQVYGQKIEYTGPTFDSLAVDGKKAVVTFSHAEGLTAGKFEMPGAGKIGEDGQVVGFTVCGEDKVFHPAKATIDGNKVVLTCDKVEKPVAVRYGFVNFMKANLYNQAGIPASPFRTDTFDVMPPMKK